MTRTRLTFESLCAFAAACCAGMLAVGRTWEHDATIPEPLPETRADALGAP